MTTFHNNKRTERTLLESNVRGRKTANANKDGIDCSFAAPQRNVGGPSGYSGHSLCAIHPSSFAPPHRMSITASPHEVWQIEVRPGAHNHFGVDLSENWTLRLDATFTDRDEARRHVLERTRTHPSTCGEVAKWLIDTNEDGKKLEILTSFCFDDAAVLRGAGWMHRLFFVGRPSASLVHDMIRGLGARHVSLRGDPR